MNTHPLLIVFSLAAFSLANHCLAQVPTAGVPARPPVAIDASKFPSLQAALNALPESGGVVNLPPGTVELTEPLLVTTGDTRIQGAGASTRLVNKNEDGKPALLIKPANLDKDPKARLWRVQVNDLRISGNPKSGDGIHAEKIQEISCTACRSTTTAATASISHDCYEDPRIADCIITYNAATGVKLVNCHDIVVNANHFEENQDALRCMDSFNLCMNGNNLDDHLRHGVIIENTYGSVLSGNMIEECNGTAIILDRDCYGITLSANVIAHHLQGGIDLKDAWGCTISANTFTIAHQFSVRVGKDSGRLTISANNFCNTHIGGKNKRPAESKTPMGIDEGTGILLQETADITISGNNFGGLSTAAVRTEGKCQRLIISGNIVTDCGRKLAKGKPLIGTAENSIIKDNIVAPAP